MNIVQRMGTDMIVILMGVSGSGKSTIGQQLARAMGWRFVEGDELHPLANVEKMRQGIPLTDADRGPWLQAIRQQIDQLQQAKQGAVITCSALKQRYREVLQSAQPTGTLRFIYLKVSPAVLRSRLVQRQGHFMKASMLDSQLAALEEPTQALTICLTATDTIEQIVAQICHRLTVGSCVFKSALPSESV
ncbi:MAG: gluconokinase [Leptolyngbyaceae cyanobacterium]